MPAGPVGLERARGRLEYLDRFCNATATECQDLIVELCDRVSGNVQRWARVGPREHPRGTGHTPAPSACDPLAFW